MSVDRRTRVAAVVLAAGRGSRFGDDGPPKPLARLGGRPLVAHALDAALRSGCSPVVLVTGHRGDEVAAHAMPAVEVVVNPAWADGLSTSLRAGLAALAGTRAVTAAAVALGDQPAIGAGAYRRLALAHRNGAGLAVATYGGVRGHPVLLGRSLWVEAMRLEGDQGARLLLARYPVVEVPCDGTGSAVDVDTPADLAALEGGEG